MDVFRLSTCGLLLAVLCLSLTGCRQAASEYRTAEPDPEWLHASVVKLTEVMMHDIFSPPQASRAYAYASVAAYEALAAGHPGYRSLSGQLNGLHAVPPPDTSQAHYLPLSSVHAFLIVAREMVYSEGRVQAFHEEMLTRVRELGLPEAVYERSLAYGDEVAQHVLSWAAADGYRQARSAPHYTVTDEPGRWQPTPPAYMSALAPNWNTLRPFVLDAAGQFKPSRPVPFSLEKGSAFYRQVHEVYEVGRELTDEERAIASFWDCNPYAMHVRGHAMFATKQITPGGHWMLITTIAARKTDAGLIGAAEAYARIAVALADGFISAWDEKYRSALVRPETVINRPLDPAWRPLLQTPPFPEYPSAHSVISASAATALTDLFGKGFAFRDTTEVAYGLPVRSFDSFMDAAEEAAISRLYGGIHYPMAVENGYTQGLKVGRLVVERLHTRNAALLAEHR